MRRSWSSGCGFTTINVDEAEQRLRTSVRRQQRSGEASGKATSFPFHRWMGSPLGKGDGPTKYPRQMPATANDGNGKAEQWRASSLLFF
nr:hypothetical protein Iba_chr08fCG0010 [Ipomoea batatas]